MASAASAAGQNDPQPAALGQGAAQGGGANNASFEPPFDATVFAKPVAPAVQGAGGASSSSGSSQQSNSSHATPTQQGDTATPSVTSLFPASYRLNPKGKKPEIVAGDSGHVEDDLSVEKLNKIHDWLGYAGRPMPPRPLNYQVSNQREITVSEQADMHLIWEIPRRIYLKPIPRYLLDYDFWKKAIVKDKELYKSALGFLWSYAALIQYESDFYIAKDHHLIPENVKWDEWIKLVDQLLRKKTDDNVNKRYQYGELRLSRLNKIYWLHFRLRGYRFPYQSYGEMFNANIAPIAAATVYIAVVLTAMQVGLATHQLQDNSSFHRASYGFTVFSILAPIALIGTVLFVLAIFFFYNWLATIIFAREANKKSQNSSQNINP